MTNWLLSRWLSLDLDLIASTDEALDSHSGASFKCQPVLERVWTGAPLWPTLECCGYTGKLPSVNVTQILERIWHAGDIKGEKNDSLTLQVPVLLRLQENTKCSPVGMELSSEWNISFFSNRSSATVDSRWNKVAASLVPESQVAERPACVLTPGLQRETSWTDYFSKRSSWLGVLAESLEGSHTFPLWLDNHRDGPSSCACARVRSFHWQWPMLSHCTCRERKLFWQSHETKTKAALNLSVCAAVIDSHKPPIRMRM